MAAVTTACLGPYEFDPTGTAPIGSLDLAVGDGASIRVVGWAIDPDTAAPVDIMVSSRQVATSHRASRLRPDVGAEHPRYGSAHGFDVRTQPLPPGLNQVCVWVPNVLRGSQDRLLGCRDVMTGSDDPIGRFDSLLRVSPTTIRAAGWAHDAEAAGSIDVTVTLDGVARPRTTAAVTRSDVQRVLRKYGSYGFIVNLTVAPGDHRVCVRAHNVGRGKDTDLGCRSIRVDSIPVVGPGRGISSVDRVGPAPGSPLYGIDRDAGISTRPADGSLLWLFGDSSALDTSGRLKYFVNNTAAWASAAKPTITRDGVTPQGTPYTFVTPSERFVPACPLGWSSAMWPASVVALDPEPNGEQRIVSYFANVCLYGRTIRSRGIAVVEWTHDPSAPPIDVPFRGSVTEQNLHPAGSEYGTAALYDGGWMYLYHCGRPTEGRTGIVWPNDPEYSGCTVARVDPDEVSDIGAHEYWSGASSWSEDPDDAVTMDIPGNPNGDKELPTGSFSVVDDPQFGYTMVYSPWPGFTEEVAIRTAPGPLGPWSARTVIKLPGCFEWAAGSELLCYAATAQPWRSTPGQLGIGYYDQLVALGPVRGAYLAASAPFGG
jgi:hypothetical protein